MGKILENLKFTVAAGVVLTVLVAYLLMEQDTMGAYARYLHAMSGVMWIGLLWYFNFVQIPTMPSIPDDLKPAIGKHIAPAALFWFRWAAMATLITGIWTAHTQGYLMDALMLDESARLIGLGMWMAIIMWFNVWFVIWPNQKVALGIVEAEAEAKPKAARMAMLFSRTNTLLSIPMLYCMISASH